MNLENQHVIVIGGSSGIGLGVAEASLAAGASLTVVGRSSEKLAAAAAKLDGRGRVRTWRDGSSRSIRPRTMSS
jgi:NAD(P)-dependent dehydrogenase (short-subunit alcohol dehydrogenase family)